MTVYVRIDSKNRKTWIFWYTILSLTVYVRTNSKIQEKNLEAKKNNYWIMSFVEDLLDYVFPSKRIWKPRKKKRFGSKLTKRRMRVDGFA